ncbi:MAG TPA: HIRAN domain-containing protein [Candidatus Hydrogenedentes bacterium]|nr:HIRAN domain-containing protein [Candidatus Hydrogenedentota bacterium]
MATIDELLSEAERIRTEYRQTTDSEARARLSARYQEIDRLVTDLRITTTKPKKVSKVLGTKVVSTDGLAVELLNLCQSITADGTITDTEIGELRKWLESATKSELPAVGFLRDIVALICRDGKIDNEERKQLYSAIETVLPTELRRFAKQRRRIVEALEKAEQRKKTATERELQRLERKASVPLIHADFMVAGVSYEGRGDIVAEHVYEGMTVFLVREPNNKYSKYATGVVLDNGLQIGYVPEEEVGEIAPLLDAGYPYKAFIKKILDSGRVPIPVVVASVFNFDAPVNGLVTKQNNPPPAPPKKRGWFR